MRGWKQVKDQEGTLRGEWTGPIKARGEYRGMYRWRHYESGKIAQTGFAGHADDAFMWACNGRPNQEKPVVQECAPPTNERWESDPVGFLRDAERHIVHRTHTTEELARRDGPYLAWKQAIDIVREAMWRIEHGTTPRVIHPPAKCWQCGARMSPELRNLTPFCSQKCERQYSATE